MEFAGDKDTFCKAYKKNTDWLADRIQREADMQVIQMQTAAERIAKDYESRIAELEKPWNASRNGSHMRTTTTCGIPTVPVEESYTSKASLADGDDIPVYGEAGGTPKFSDRRVTCGQYRAKTGMILNADVNSAENIIHKRYPECVPGRGGLPLSVQKTCDLIDMVATIPVYPFFDIYLPALAKFVLCFCPRCQAVSNPHLHQPFFR